MTAVLPLSAVLASAAATAQTLPQNEAQPVAAPADDAARAQGLQSRLSATFDVYGASVRSAGGAASTAATSGTHGKVSLEGDLRVGHEDSEADYLYFSALHSGDRSVLQVPRPVNLSTLQFGRHGRSVSVTAGDIAPHFSTLSTSMPARGVSAQGRLGLVAVTAYTGALASDWQALLRGPAAHLPHRRVMGAKAELTVSDSVQAYATSQRSVTGLSPHGTASRPDTASSFSLGLHYRRGDFALQAEAARSSASDAALGERDGRASVIDAAWHGETWSLRAGHHDISPRFASFSAAARTGLRQGYATLDWRPHAQVSVSVDARGGSTATWWGAAYEEGLVDNRAAAITANLSLEPLAPGLSLQMQHSRSVDTAQTGAESRQEIAGTSASLAYSGGPWSMAFAWVRREVSIWPHAAQSRADQFALTAARSFQLAGRWPLFVSASAKTDSQRFADGARVSGGDAALQLAADAGRWGTWNVGLTHASLQSPRVFGPASLRSRGVQAEATHRLGPGRTLKLYVRHLLRNGNDPVLAAQERVVGMQFGSAF